MSQGNPKDSSRRKLVSQARREQRQLEAAERNEVTAKLSIEERLDRCARRPGNSERERLRLHRALQSQTTTGKKK
jgi:hypothetical protein